MCVLNGVLLQEIEKDGFLGAHAHFQRKLPMHYGFEALVFHQAREAKHRNR